MNSGNLMVWLVGCFKVKAIEDYSVYMFCILVPNYLCVYVAILLRTTMHEKCSDLLSERMYSDASIYSVNLSIFRCFFFRNWQPVLGRMKVYSV